MKNIINKFEINEEEFELNNAVDLSSNNDSNLPPTCKSVYQKYKSIGFCKIVNYNKPIIINTTRYIPEGKDEYVWSVEVTIPKNSLLYPSKKDEK